jgi:excisionase family DNA binding protein
MAETDYSTWVSKQDAATTLGVSPKQIERLAKAGRIQSFLWKRPSGGQSIVVYAPDDIERVAHENAPSRPFVVPTPTPPTPAPTSNGNNGNGHALQRQTDRQDRQDRQDKPVAPSNKAELQAFSTILRHMSRQAQTAQTVFLTIPEAADFTGLTETYISRACREGRLPALKDGGWKIRRTDLLAL